MQYRCNQSTNLTPRKSLVFLAKPEPLLPPLRAAM